MVPRVVVFVPDSVFTLLTDEVNARRGFFFADIGQFLAGGAIDFFYRKFHKMFTPI